MRLPKVIVDSRFLSRYIDRITSGRLSQCYFHDAHKDWGLNACDCETGITNNPGVFLTSLVLCGDDDDGCGHSFCKACVYECEYEWCRNFVCHMCSRQCFCANSQLAYCGCSYCGNYCADCYYNHGCVFCDDCDCTIPDDCDHDWHDEEVCTK